jgi:hypothetical protein
MTALALRWRLIEPLCLTWIGPTPDLVAQLQTTPPSAIAAFVGAPGTAGPSGGTTLSKTASTSLQGQYAVKSTGDSTVGPPDPGTPSDANLIVGITTGAASSGDPVMVRSLGEMVDPGWSWTPDLPVFVGAGGVLTQVVPTSGWLLQVGFAESATKLLIGLRPPLQLLNS